MEPENWQIVERIFNQAVLLPEFERKLFVEMQCSKNDDIYAEVISLLDTDNQPDKILEQSVFPFVAQLLESDFTQLLEKSDFGAYKLQKLLGRGGMGAVFLANDTRLGRLVALKILPREIAENIETILRFRQEAKAASTISHPNVAHIYEFGIFDGMYFLAMEYVSGKTLRDRLSGKQIDLSSAVNTALQVADALKAAHEKHITHRDIKPENIMLTDERLVKVLDFGLAKFSEKIDKNKNSGLETLPGLIMGTTAYMSPEQIRGERIDQRTDLWSLGIVLYEMIAGQRPFEAETPSDRQAAILLKDLPAVPLKEEIPNLDRIIQKALTKDVALRYQSAEEIIDDLRKLQRDVYDYLESQKEQKSSVKQTIATEKIASTPKTFDAKINRQKFYFGVILAGVFLAAGALAYSLYFSNVFHKKSASSIAVLPFVNGSADPNTEYLSDGIAESLINNLSQLPDVKVIARNSSFKFKGKEIDPQEVARVLGVEAIVTGQIVQMKDNLIISVEMINAADRTQMWGAQYNHKVSDLFQMQSEISSDIAGKMRVRLTGLQGGQQFNKEPVNPQAYELELKGLYYWNKGGTENRKKSIDYFNQAITIDPNYAVAYADLSIGYTLLVSNGILPPNEFAAKAEDAARKALELNSNLAEAHLALGWIKLNDWNWSEAESEYRRSIEINPNLARAHNGYAYYLSFTGHHDRAIAEIERAKVLDPISLITNADAGNIRYLARQYDQAIEELKSPIELDPNFATTYVYLGYAYSGKAEYIEAIKAYRKAIQLTGETPSRLIFLGAALANSNKRDQAKEILKQLQNGKEYFSPGELAILYAALDEKEKAFTSLEKAFSEHDLQLQYLERIRIQCMV